jgi:hypothetical protein
VIVLRSEDLLVRADPRHGAEILDLVHLPTGRQLLGRAPFASAEPLAGDLEEPVWTASYRGGWQMVAPNAGARCIVGGGRHGFHGRASNDPWEVLESGGTAASFRWSGHGLELTRRLFIEGGTLAVTVEARSAGERVPLVAVEHLSVGLELIDPEVEIELPRGLAFEQSETAGPPEKPDGAPTWPEVLLLDGSTERADRWRLADERSRFMVVTDIPEGRARVRNAANGMTLRLEWDAGLLRHVWVWHEVRMYEGPWRRQAEILVIEPASVPHALGLATAIGHGQASWLEPGESLSYTLEVTAEVT